MKFLHTFTKCSFLVAALMLFSSALLAQRTVKGKVTDAESGEGLIGATVAVVGTTRGAATDIDGNYSVDVPAGATQLRFSYTGYAETVVDLDASNVVNAALKAGTVLDEVVVVGYGTIKAKEVTSAVASLKKEDFNKGNITSAAQLIQGKIAGVSVTRPGSDPNGGFAIRLRGLSSLQSGVSPLIVVDGIPGVDLSLVDPNDIASIDVLKDASAAAIYGTRASAGVVLITTSKGNAGRMIVDYNGFVAMDQVAKRYETLSADEFVQFGGTDLSPNANTDTDWFNEITQTGVSQAHNMTISGGLGNGSYRASFNVRDVQGILRTSGLTQYNGGLNFTQKALNNRLSLSGNLFMTARDANFSFNEAFRYAIVNNPTAGVTSEDAEFRRFGGYVEKDLFDYFNPVAMIEQNSNTGKINRLLGNLRAEFEIAPNLVAALTVAQERFNGDFNEYYSKQSRFRGIDRNGLGRRGNFTSVNRTLESTLNYKINFGKTSNLSLLGGYSFQDFKNEGLGIQAGNIISNELASNSFGTFLDLNRGLAEVYSSYKNESRLVAFFGRASLNIDDTYFLSAGLRREGSTRFGPENKWGLFPFVSGGVNLEKLVDLNNVEQLKLRVGYGITGAQPNEGNQYRLTFVSGPRFFYNGNYVPSFAPNRNPNPSLKWEEKNDFNVGLDYALFNYKLTGSLDFYNSQTKDLILPLTVPVPPNLATTTIDNVATLRAVGFEATATLTDLVKKDNFSWSPTLVFNTYNITLEDFGRNDTIAYANVGAPGQNGVFYTIVYNGADLGQLWGPVRTGVGSDGKLTYEDIDGDGQSGGTEIEGFNQDQKKIGDGVPF